MIGWLLWLCFVVKSNAVRYDGDKKVFLTSK